MAIGLEPLKLNGSNTTRSCSPPFKSVENVASDRFSIRLDNGLETCPRIDFLDPGSMAVETGAGRGGGGGQEAMAMAHGGLKPSAGFSVSSDMFQAIALGSQSQPRVLGG